VAKAKLYFYLFSFLLFLHFRPSSVHCLMRSWRLAPSPWSPWQYLSSVISSCLIVCSSFARISLHPHSDSCKFPLSFPFDFCSIVCFTFFTSWNSRPPSKFLLHVYIYHSTQSDIYGVDKKPHKVLGYVGQGPLVNFAWSLFLIIPDKWRWS
jgi:hypothetical protein